MAKGALALDESYSPAYVALSAVAVIRKEHEKAVTLAEKAIALSPNSAQGYSSLGLTYVFCGRPGKG